MLRELRASAQGFFAKIILLFLVACFVFWGIGDVFRSSGANASIAKVGNTTISAQEYQRALHQRTEELRQILGANYNAEFIKQLGIGPQVLSRLINSLLIEKEASSLGIVVGDDEIAHLIGVAPEFQDQSKHFNKSLYLAYLRNKGVVEQRYVTDLRKELAAQLLLKTLLTGVQVPQDLVLALYRARFQQRDATFIVITPESAASVANPDEKEIEAYYTQHQKLFLTPQYRTISYVEIKPSDIQAKTTVSEDEIKHTYDDHEQDFHKSEKRTVLQMVFAKETDAKKADADLTKGKSFDEVAKTAPITNKGKLSLGDVSAQDVPSDAGIIFALKAGENSQPLQSPFGWHIFHVEKIIPEGPATLADVHDEIARDLAARQGQEAIYKKVGALEDALAAGSTLEKAAETVGQTVHTVGPVDSKGLEADGKKAKLPPYENFITTAFATTEKENSQAVQSSDGSYFLLHVDSVAPEQAKKLAEVKDAIITSLKTEKSAAQMQVTAKAVSEDLRAGKSLAKVLASHHVSASAVIPAKLRHNSEALETGPLAGKPLPKELMGELFALKVHDATHAYTVAGSDVVAVLNNVLAAPDVPDDKAVAAIRKELEETMSNEAIEQYISYLQEKYRVTINTSMLNVKDEESSQ